MIKVEAPKSPLAKLWGNLTPEQASALAKVMMVLGLCLIVKSLLDMWPSIWSILIRILFATALVVCGIRALRLWPNTKWVIKWLVPAFIGVALNVSVMLANGGYMPSVIRTTAWGIYIPLDGTNLTYLADWIWHGMSPGDILILGAAVGIVATMIRNRQQRAVEQQV